MPDCPLDDCGYEAETSHGLSIHWSKSGGQHTGKLSDRQAVKKVRHEMGGRGEYVEQLGHSVASGFEKEIALHLQKNGIDYEVDVSFELADRVYFADFVVGDVVVEAKGEYASEISEEDFADRAAEFCEQRDESYVLVGAQGPCDVHIDWPNERDQLVSILSSDP